MPGNIPVMSNVTGSFEFLRVSLEILGFLKFFRVPKGFFDFLCVLMFLRLFGF